MIGLPKHPLSQIPIEHHSQQTWNVGHGTKMPRTHNVLLTNIDSTASTTRASRPPATTTATAKTATTKRSYSMGALLVPQNKPHNMPNLQQYIAPSMRATLQEVPTRYTSQTSINATRAQTLKREKHALRALSKHAGLGHTKIRFRSSRVGAEVALTKVSTQWNDNQHAQTTRTLQRQRRPEDSSASASAYMPTPKQIEECLQALEALPSHLSIVIPTLRRAIYSDGYVGVIPGAKDPSVLNTCPYYSVVPGLEKSNGFLLENIEELKSKLMDVQRDRNDQRALLQQSNGKNQELRNKITAEEQKNIIIKKELSNMRDIASDYLEEKDNMTKRYVELDQQHHVLFTEHKDTTAQLSDLREVYSSVSKELGHAIRTCGQLETQSKSYRKQIAEANQTLAEHANLKAQYEQLAIESETTKEELDLLKEDMQRISDKRAALALKKMRLGR